MIVGVCGYGYSGSGAYIDLLKEYSDVQVIFDRLEFKLSYMQDGLEDLSYHLVEHPVRFYSSDVAIRRFKKLICALDKSYGPRTNGKFMDYANEYLQEIIQISWKGTCSFHRIECTGAARFFRYSLAERLRKMLYRYFRIWISYPDIEMYLSISPPTFHAATKKFLNNIIAAMGADRRIIVLNQPFPADRPELSFPFYDDPRAICVSRDPRDLYLLAKEVVKHKARFIPTDNVETFIEYYRRIMSNSTAEAEQPSRILRISFEQLVYAYDETKERLGRFIGMTEHDHPGEHFNPEISIRNTQLSKRFPQYDDDIRRIEAALPEWLFPFEQYGSQTGIRNGKIF